MEKVKSFKQPDHAEGLQSFAGYLNKGRTKSTLDMGAIMTDNVIPLKRPDHLAEVSAGLELLKKFHNTGGHNELTISLIMAKMTDDIVKVQEQLTRR